MRRLRLPHAARLHGNADFSRVRAGGMSRTGRLLRLGALLTGADEPARIGVVTSRRVGAAVVRVRVRRRLREICRIHRHLLARGCHLVVVARPHAASACYEELQQEWLHLARKLHILNCS